MCPSQKNDFDETCLWWYLQKAMWTLCRYFSILYRLEKKTLLNLLDLFGMSRVLLEHKLADDRTYLAHCRLQSFPYVMPSVPHTGKNMNVQMHGTSASGTKSANGVTAVHGPSWNCATPLKKYRQWFWDHRKIMLTV